MGLTLFFAALVAGCTNGQDATPASGAPQDTDDTAADDAATDDTATDDDTGPAALPTSGLALDNASIFDGEGWRSGAVVIVDEEIWGVVDAGQDWPEGLEVRDLSGRYLIPGLIDSHVHLFHAGTTTWTGSSVEDNLRANLAWGVTGVVDVGSPVEIYSLAARIASGELLGPRIRATGPFLTAEGSHPCEGVYDETLCVFVDGDGADRADEALAGGADLIKVALADNDFTDHATPRLDLGDLADIAATGEVVAHIAQSDDAADALAAGVRTLAHPVFADPIDASIAGLAFDGVHSTVAAVWGVVAIMGFEDQPAADLDGPNYVALSSEVRESWRWLQQYPDALVDGWVADNAAWSAQLRENLGVYRAEAAPMVAGSDAGYWFVAHGTDLHRELADLVDAGWSEAEALQAATSAPAALAGWDDLGWIDAGYRADLVVLSADPLAAIANTREIEAVVLGGAWRARVEVLALDLWASDGDGYDGGGFCLDDRDCGGGCDLVTHRCAELCAEPYAFTGACDEETWCAPAEGLATDTQGVCRAGDGCDLYAQDCEPASYGQTCVPADTDTNTCFPAGEQGQGEACSWTDPTLYCETGLMCSWLSYRCYELCDPDGPNTCAVGQCNQEYAAPGEPWFGLCY